MLPLYVAQVPLAPKESPSPPLSGGRGFIIAKSPFIRNVLAGDHPRGGLRLPSVGSGLLTVPSLPLLP